MRGDLLSYWEPATTVGAAERGHWLAAAERIAGGIAELAHLEAFVDAAHYRVGFSCDGDTELAADYARAIRDENVEARQVAPAGTPDGDAPADEIVLPCRPGASDEEITHAVLAALKASHALEFIVLPLSDAGD